MSANVHGTTYPRMFAAGELTAYLRSAVAVLLAVAAVFLASRRLAGALGTPLAPGQLLVVAVLLAGLAQIAHGPTPTGRLRGFRGAAVPAAWAGETPAPRAIRRLTLSVLVSLAMLTITASLMLPGSHRLALLGYWTVIVGEELWAWRGMWPAQRSKSPLPYAREGGHHAPMIEVRADLQITEIEPAEPAGDVLQQLTLRTTAEGGQELSGWLRMRLAAGQRTGNLHVAFCPSFNHVPQVLAEPVSGPDCRIKAAQVLPYGARLDVKLDEPAGVDESVLVWFFAHSEA